MFGLHRSPIRGMLRIRKDLRVVLQMETLFLIEGATGMKTETLIDGSLVGQESTTFDQALYVHRVMQLIAGSLARDTDALRSQVVELTSALAVVVEELRELKGRRSEAASRNGAECAEQRK